MDSETDKTKNNEVLLSHIPNIGLRVYAVENGIRIGQGYRTNVYSEEEVLEWLKQYRLLKDK